MAKEDIFAGYSRYSLGMGAYENNILLEEKKTDFYQERTLFLFVYLGDRIRVHYLTLFSDFEQFYYSQMMSNYLESKTQSRLGS